MSNRERTREIAAAKAGMDVKTAEKYLRARRLPSEMKMERYWRTRKDPFEATWPRVVTWLESEPDRTAKELFARLREERPGAFTAGQVRTLQRRVKEWRTLAGYYRRQAALLSAAQ